MVHLKRIFGRRIRFDGRSRGFALRDVLPERPLRSYTWRCVRALDQGAEGSCVGHGVAHELIARPSEAPGIDHDYAVKIYRAAQKIDQWPGENYEGSSVLAGMTVARDWGWFDEFRWTFTLKDLLRGIAWHGPAVMGTAWPDSMFQPGDWNIVKIEGEIPTDQGHCYLLNGINVPRRLCRLHNSWKDWGLFGEAWIGWDDLERLIHSRGEACFAVGRHVKPKRLAEEKK